MTSTRPCAARVSLGDDVVAETRAALRVDVPGAAPTLWFPAADAAAVPCELVATGEGDLAGYVAVDPDRARVELIDGRDGDDPRDVTLKRFPTWGDAADLIDLLNVRPQPDGSYVSMTRDTSEGLHRGVVEGSQMLAQAIVAAGRHAPLPRTRRECARWRASLSARRTRRLRQPI